ncbi:hypothetical protein LX36DRAFT_649202 [Colletotrichum falcatum]|nr:hypothetical protein LX36DRAFT_649202 [Colletotrichum falcatum]
MHSQKPSLTRANESECGTLLCIDHKDSTRDLQRWVSTIYFVSRSCMQTASTVARARRPAVVWQPTKAGFYPKHTTPSSSRALQGGDDSSDVDEVLVPFRATLIRHALCQYFVKLLFQRRMPCCTAQSVKARTTHTYIYIIKLCQDGPRED